MILCIYRWQIKTVYAMKDGAVFSQPDSHSVNAQLKLSLWINLNKWNENFSLEVTDLTQGDRHTEQFRFFALLYREVNSRDMLLFVDR